MVCNGEIQRDENEPIRKRDDELLHEWHSYLVERELAPSTIRRYECEVQRFRSWLAGDPFSATCGLAGIRKGAVLDYRSRLINSLSPSGANVAVVAINSLWEFMGKPELKVKGPRIQTKNLRPLNSNLTYAEYLRLVEVADGLSDPRISLVLQSLCSTGLRVSELSYLTVETLDKGVMWVSNKGKARQVVLPRELCGLLRGYCRRLGLREGPIFVGNTGRPITRTTVWRWLKSVAALAEISDEKVYPHNLRHLFATRYFENYRDLDAVSVALGHSRLETTRIYIALTSVERRDQIESLGLVARK